MARIGGDELAVIAPDAGTDDVVALARRILMQASDVALYDANRAGRYRTCVPAPGAVPRPRVGPPN